MASMEISYVDQYRKRVSNAFNASMTTYNSEDVPDVENVQDSCFQPVNLYPEEDEVITPQPVKSSIIQFD